MLCLRYAYELNADFSFNQDTMHIPLLALVHVAEFNPSWPFPITHDQW